MGDIPSSKLHIESACRANLVILYAVCIDQSKILAYVPHP